MRIDAEENRDRIIAAARRVFAEAGDDVPMSRVARRAGVAVATLYRRFPTRDHLIADTYADQWRECAGRLAAAERDPDPGRAFRSITSTLALYQVIDRGFTVPYVAALLGGEGFEEPRRESERVAGALLARGQRAGVLRPELTRDDVMLLLAGNRGVIAAAAPRTAAAASRAFVAHMLRAFHLPR